MYQRKDQILSGILCGERGPFLVANSGILCVAIFGILYFTIHRDMTIEKKPLLRLTSDFVFKAVYGQDTPESQAALRALLNCLLDKKDDPIEWVRCENPFILPKYIGRKESVLDIKARLSSGQLIV